MNKITAFLTVLIFIFLIPFFTSNSYAYHYDFSQASNEWNYEKKEGEIVFENGYMKMFVNGASDYFPIVYNNANLALPESYDLIINFKYDSAGWKGTGIGIGFTSTDLKFYNQFQIWRDSGPNSNFIHHNFNNQEYSYCTNFNGKNDLVGRDPAFYLPITLNTNHAFRLFKNDNKFVVYFDGQQIYASQFDECSPNLIMFGNPLGAGGVGWTNLSIDDLNLTELKTKRKIVIIPGLGASWQPVSILTGTTDPSLSWSMTPFVRNYDKLKKALEDNGMDEGEEYYVWNYDWRLPVDEISERLDNYIDSITTDGSKVDIVGHSLGGLVGLDWAAKEKSDNDSKLGKVITLGTPHFGSIKAYEAWAGAKVGDGFDPASIAMNVLVKLISKGQSSQELGAVRTYAPVLKDLMPTIEFARKNGNYVLVNDMVVVNDWLQGLNTRALTVMDELNEIYGNGVNTKRWLDLSGTPGENGYWPDGQIVGDEWADGDGTVMIESAYYPNDDHSWIDYGEHGELPKKAIPLLMEKLGLNPVVVDNNVEEKKDLAIYMGSPAVAKLICGGIEKGVSDNLGWLLVDSNGLTDCQIKVEAFESGEYHLVVGKLNQSGDKWSYSEGTVTKDEVVNYQINTGNGEIEKEEPPVVVDDWGEIGKIITELKTVYKNKTNPLLTQYKKKNLFGLLEAVFNFRAETRESDKTEVLLTHLSKLILEDETSNRVAARNQMIRAMVNKELLDKLLPILTRNKVKQDALGVASTQKVKDNYEEMISLFTSKQYLKAELLAREISGWCRESWPIKVTGSKYWY